MRKYNLTYWDWYELQWSLSLQQIFSVYYKKFAPNSITNQSCIGYTYYSPVIKCSECFQIVCNRNMFTKLLLLGKRKFKKFSLIFKICENYLKMIQRRTRIKYMSLDKIWRNINAKIYTHAHSQANSKVNIQHSYICFIIVYSSSGRMWAIIFSNVS